VRTGKLVWSFHTIPHPGELGYATWPDGEWKTAGAANNWAGMAVDARRGLVFVPTGSAVSDFYGFDRVVNDLYADCLMALDAATGRLVWYFQGAHHDIWDRDFPSPPALVTLMHDGKRIDAVAQTTKQGFVFVFDRVTGQSLYPIEERPFPASTVSGEVASKTQPIPLASAPYARQLLTADMLTTRTPEAHRWAVNQFKSFRSGGFVPFAVDIQTVIFPGFDGGAEWGGPAIDPEAGVIYINSNDLPWTGGLTENHGDPSSGDTVYQTQCATCHGTDQAGSPPAFPSLVDIGKRMKQTEITETVRNGKGRMPGFPNLTNADMAALLHFLNLPMEPSPATADAGGRGEPVGNAAASSSSAMPKYRFAGYRKFLDPEGYPAVVPPWGTLNAIDLNTGKYLWKIPLGNYPELAAKGMADTGTENYGGPILTAGGVLFIGATLFDHKLHAFDPKTGKLLWQGDLPFAGNATPCTYMIDGKQYVVIATAGSRNPKGPQGAAYVAFALP
jgi:quinoprotein glucose dehydrogenase